MRTLPAIGLPNVVGLTFTVKVTVSPTRGSLSDTITVVVVVDTTACAVLTPIGAIRPMQSIAIAATPTCFPKFFINKSFPWPEVQMNKRVIL
jgi:hypothetical protein